MSITPGSGLIINISYDSSVASAPSGFQTTVAAAVTYLESIFTNPITLNIAVGYNEVDGQRIGAAALGESLNNGVYASYAQLLAAMPGAGLPASNPTGSGVYYVADAEAKALGLATDGSSLDGWIGISSAYSFSYDPNNPAPSGQYDAIATFEHEITEVMGRTSELGAYSYHRALVYTPLDLFRYSAPGVRDLTRTSGYFSPNGTTMTALFNNPTNGGDGGDWASSVVGDAFGDGSTGIAGQVSGTDVQVMQALGYATVASTVAATVPAVTVPASTVPSATVLGVNNAIQTLLCDTSADAAIAQSLLAPLSASVLAGSLLPTASVASIPAGKRGMLVASLGGVYAMATGYSALVDSATAPATVFGGASNGQVVVAGTGGLAFNAGSGSGTVMAAGGNNLFSVLTGGGAQDIIAGGGADTIEALAGANTINAGAGSNLILAQGGNNIITSGGSDLIDVPDGNATISATGSPVIFLGGGASQVTDRLFGQSTVVVGSGAATVNANGSDQIWMQSGGGVVNAGQGAATIIGGAGAATVNGTNGQDFIFAGSGLLTYVGGADATTILGAGNGSTSLFGGSGTLIDIAYGATNFVGGVGSATVAAFGGSVTISGGTGTGVFLGGPGGNNRIAAGTGNATIIGGGSGDVLSAGTGADVLQAGPGAETLFGGASTGLQGFYGGSGPEEIVFGTAASQLLTGTGSETIAGGAGQGLIAFTSGNATNAVIEGFTTGQDFISLVGFAPGAVTSALAGATTNSGSEQLTLSDGTKILFQGFSGLTASSFL